MSEKKDGEEKKDFEELEIQQDTGSLTWAQPRTKGDVPAARSGHTLTVVGSNAYLFGGCVEGDIVGPTDEIYILKLQPADSKSAMTWVKPKTGGATPSKRWGILLRASIKSSFSSSAAFIVIPIASTMSTSSIRPITVGASPMARLRQSSRQEESYAEERRF